MVTLPTGSASSIAAPSDRPNYPRLTYLGPALNPVDTDAARAAMIVDRIRSRCPELTAADLLLVSRVITASERGKDGSPKKAPAKRAPPAKRRA